MLKLLILINLFIASPLTFANSRVGNFSTINPQLTSDFGRIKTDPTIRIIHSTPSLNGVLRISVGRINQNQWQVQTIDIPDDLLIQSDLYQEIQKSIDLNDWVEIKN